MHKKTVKTSTLDTELANRLLPIKFPFEYVTRDQKKDRGYTHCWYINSWNLLSSNSIKKLWIKKEKKLCLPRRHSACTIFINKDNLIKRFKSVTNFSSYGSKYWIKVSPFLHMDLQKNFNTLYDDLLIQRLTL